MFFSRSNPPPQVSIDFSESLSLTKQSFRDECDVNNIIKQYVKNGIAPHGNSSSGSFFDASTSSDYQSALNLVISANESFAALPAAIRKKFGNDPVNYIEFVEDPANAAEARSLGLLNPIPEPPAPMDVRIVPDATASPPGE